MLIHNKNADKIADDLPDKGLAGWRELRPVLEEIIKALPFALHIEAPMDGQEIAGGIAIKA